MPSDYHLTMQQMLDMLEHDEDTDLWVLNKDGTTSIIPGGDEAVLARCIDSNSWPRLICKSRAVNQLVNGMGAERALRMTNEVIDTIILPSRSKVNTFARVLADAVRAARRGQEAV